MANKPIDEEALRNKPLLNVEQAARKLSVSRSLVYKLVQTGALPVVRIGDTVRFRPEDVEALIVAMRKGGRRNKRKKGKR
jgi:excisionase family DNA binding protein